MKFRVGLLLILVLETSFAHGNTEISESPEGASAWRKIRERLRMRGFTEVVSPAFKDNGTTTPLPDGRKNSPVSAYHIVWADYEIGKNYKLLYWQKAVTTLASPQNFQSPQFDFRDPRFGIRKTQVFDNPHLNTTFDLYLQPGLVRNQFWSKNQFEVGARSNCSYSFPRSKWNIGMITEFTTAYLNAAGQGPRAYGWTMPWASYDWSPKFSTQHYVNVPFVNLRSSGCTRFAWDDPSMPFMQNGISYNLSPDVSASLLINNFLMKAPNLKNTWGSLWLSLNVL